MRAPRTHLRPMAVNIAIAVVGIVCIDPNAILLFFMLIAAFGASGAAYQWFCWLEENGINPFLKDAPALEDDCKADAEELFR